MTDELEEDLYGDDNEAPDDEEVVEEEGFDETEDDAESEDDEPKKAPRKTPEERIRDLQRENDRLRAAANKKAKVRTPVAANSTRSALPPELREWVDQAKSTTRDSLYAADPRYKEFGIDPGLIVGETAEEMRASAASLKKVVDRMESRIRNRVLVEHGIASAPQTGTKPATGGRRNDWRNMSSEDFLKFADAADRGELD